jgi:hypothetical protein
MCLWIYCEGVNCVWHFEVFRLPIVVWINLLENRNGPAVAGGINSAQAWIELDDIRPGSHRQEGDGFVFVEI